MIIVTHTNPDGDAVGASLAMYLYLVSKGHQVSVIIPDPSPAFLSWLPGHDQVLVFSQKPEKCIQLIQEASCIFCMDFNTLSRTSAAEPYLSASRAQKILIDHHLFPSDQFDHRITNVETSSTSELVYDLIEACSDLKLLNRDIAICLYAGIITDTGSFSYSCNYVKTYCITAELFRLGIDGEHIHRLIYDTYSESRLRLLGYCLSERLTVLPQYHTAYMVLTRDDLKRFQYQIGDTEGVVNYALSIGIVNLAALFMERDDYVKASFRSKGNFNVEEIARNYFKGGGHSNASGANCYEPLQNVVQRFIEILPRYVTRLKTVY
jgi:phosphoesterase RecJ-like protein